jgi:DNA-binding MarR family transcriptional regulator
VRIVSALRRIMRRVEIGSVELETAHAITAPQLVCLLAIVRAGQITQVDLSREVHLGASTLVGVIDRLQDKGLVQRTRDREDRRRILISATPAGHAKASQAPEPLQRRLERGLADLSAGERHMIITALDQIVTMLDADDIEAAGVLASGPIPKPQELEGKGL